MSRLRIVCLGIIVWLGLAANLWGAMDGDQISLSIQKITFSSSPDGPAYLYLNANQVDGSPVLGLQRGNIQVVMDGHKPMAIDSMVPFAGTDRGLAYVLVVDTNENLATSLTTVHQGAVNFIKALGFRYWGSLVTYAEPPAVLVSPTLDAERLLEAASGLEPLTGPPQLAEGLLLAVDVLDKTVEEHKLDNGRTVIILFTEGRDQGSRFSLEAAAAKVLESGAQLFVIGYGPSEAPGLTALKELAVKTGGKWYYLPDPDGIPEILVTVADILKYQYIISFRNDGIADGGEHKVEVTVSGGGLNGKTHLQFVSPRLPRITLSWPIVVGSGIILILLWRYGRRRRAKRL